MPAGLVLVGVLGVTVLILGATRIGRVVGTASEHFLLYYAGVFVLLALTATVGIGLLSTDRIVMTPAGRVTAQAVHRAASAGAMAFLFIHIATEIVAKQSHAVDVLLPFLDHGRTFYLGLGTVASDLMVMIAVTGIFRARLAANMSPLKWRLLHGSAYAAWVISIVHGLLAGRPAKSFFGFSGFVAWSYGFCVVAVAIALGVRLVAKDRSGQTEGQPIPDRPVTPWSPAALGAPVLGQAGFGAAQLSAAPARQYQRALPAPPSAPGSAARPALPAGRQISDGRFGPDEMRTAFGQDESRGAFGQDQSRGAFGQDDQSRTAFGQDQSRGAFGQDQSRGAFGQDQSRGAFGLDETRAAFGWDDGRGFPGRDDVRAYPGRDDVRGFADTGDPRGFPGQRDSRAYPGRDDVRGFADRDSPRGFPGRDDPRGFPGRDDPRAYPGRDDVRGYPGQGDPREGFGQDEPRAAFGRDDAPGRFDSGDDYAAQEETGPLPVVPYSRYGTRS